MISNYISLNFIFKSNSIRGMRFEC